MIGDLYDKYRTANGEYASFGRFMRSSDVKGIIADHNAKLAKIIGRQAGELGDPFNAKTQSSSSDLSSFHRK